MEALAISFGADQARINSEAVAADQPLVYATLHGRLKQPTKQIAVAERPCRFLEKVEWLGRRLPVQAGRTSDVPSTPITEHARCWLTAKLSQR